MYIIDKNKDYYDYISHIYGVDKKVTFDRRGSVFITDSTIESIIRHPKYSKENYIVLEIGCIQYLLKLSNFKYIEEIAYTRFDSFKMEIIYVYRDNKHYYNSVISIREVTLPWEWEWKLLKKSKVRISGNYKADIKDTFDNVIALPILANTGITSLIKPEEIWIELQTYLSSLNNDKTVDIKLTDVEKAVNHGFDKKTSFRHPIK